MKEETFRIFNGEELGRLFLPDGFIYENTKALYVSPIHGRAVALKKDDYEWISVKGGGWNYRGPEVYISTKDEELIFGLYPFCAAEREMKVSHELIKISDEFPKVLYCKKFCDYSLPPKYGFLKDIKFKNGKRVNPCLLYTKLKSPFRVADLIYLSDSEKRQIVDYSCKYWDIKQEDFTKRFTEKLAKNVALMHKYGFINDTLEFSNVTMLAEIVDYEWVTAPGIKLLDGTYGLEICDERREKEILYGSEVCLQLKAMLHEEYNLFDIISIFAEAYKEINPQFIINNKRTQSILNKEEFII